MSPTNDAFSQELHRVSQIWAQAYEEEGGPKDKTVQILILGRNIRVNVAKALEAAFSTIKMIPEAVKAHAGQLGAIDWIGLGVEAMNVISSTYAALVESMPALEYVACVVLSGHPQGLEQVQLQAEIENFFKMTGSADLPWYLHLSKARIAEAFNATKSPRWMEHLMDDLHEHDWLNEDGNLLKFKNRNFTWGFKLGA